MTSTEILAQGVQTSYKITRATDDGKYYAIAAGESGADAVVLSQEEATLQLSGGTMSGNIDMGLYDIDNVGNLDADNIRGVSGPQPYFPTSLMVGGSGYSASGGAKITFFSDVSISSADLETPADLSANPIWTLTPFSGTFVMNAGDQTIDGLKEFTTRPKTSATDPVEADDLISLSDADARFLSPVAAGYVPMNIIGLYRTYSSGTVTTTIPSLSVSNAYVATSTTQTNYAIVYAFPYQGVMVAYNSTNAKVFGDKYGWILAGFLSCRPVGCLTRTIIGGNTTAADMAAEGALGANGIALESRADVINVPKFRLVARSGATTTVGTWSATGIVNVYDAGEWWIVINGGTIYCYYRAGFAGPWTLLYSVNSALPAFTGATNGIAIVAATPDSGAISGSFVALHRGTETFGILP